MPSCSRSQAGRRPARIGEHLRPLRVVGLTEIALRHRPAPPRPPFPQPIGVVLAEDHLAPGDLAHRLPGDVVLGGANAAGHHHCVGTADCDPDRIGDAGEIVADRLLVVGVDAPLGEGRPHGGGVRVDDLAEQELGPHRDDLDDHSASITRLLPRRLDHDQEIAGADRIGERVPGGVAHHAVLFDLGAGEVNCVHQGVESVVEVIGLGDGDTRFCDIVDANRLIASATKASAFACIRISRNK